MELWRFMYLFFNWTICSRCPPHHPCWSLLILTCKFSTGPLPASEESPLHSCYPSVWRNLSPLWYPGMSLMRCLTKGPFIAAVLCCKLPHCFSVIPVRSKLWRCPWISNSPCLYPIVHVFMYKYLRWVPVMLLSQEMREFFLSCFVLCVSLCPCPILLLFWGLWL